MKINYNQEDVENHDGVAAIIRNQDGKILMQEHIKYGFWTIPVGKVKNGQNVLDGLKEEILEECNIQILDCREIARKDYFYERDGKNVKVDSHLYEILKYEGEVKNMEPQKHRQQIFLPIEKISQISYLSDLTILFLQQLGIDREAKI